MDEVERRALKALRFNWAPTPDDVWRQPAFHVDGLHRDALRIILDGVDDADRSSDSSPVGVAVLGQRGSGKTHLLGSVRERVQAGGGYFFLISLLEASAFWRSAALSVIEGLNRETAEQESQLKIFLRRLADLVGAPRTVRRAIIGEAELTRPFLDAFVDLVRKHHRQVGMDCQDTMRALVLEAAEKTSDQDVGHEFLCSNDELEPGQRAAWGMRRARRSAQEIVRDISRLLALTGPTVIAVDQIDLLINQAAKALDGGTRLEWRAALLLEQIAGGLMSLRETTRRTLSVVACLDESWTLIKTQATDTVQDRFREAVQLRQIGTAELGKELVARRFAAPFADQGFTPPYDTWPVRASAFVEAVQFTPRELLRTIDTHVRACLRDDTVREMARLVRDAVSTGPVLDGGDPPAAGELAEIDARYAALRAAADPGPALDPSTEDAVVPSLLSAGLTAWIGERGASGELYGLDPEPGNKPALHARLRHSLAEHTEDEEHWAFRAIHARHPVAALNRIRNASTAAGLTEGVAKRKLFFLRNDAWSGGARTTEVIETFTRAGGQTLPFPTSDVTALLALRQLIRERGFEGLRAWFAVRRPTEEISFLQAALSDAGSAAAGADIAAATDVGVAGASELAGGAGGFAGAAAQGGVAGASGHGGRVGAAAQGGVAGAAGHGGPAGAADASRRGDGAGSGERAAAATGGGGEASSRGPAGAARRGGLTSVAGTGGRADAAGTSGRGGDDGGGSPGGVARRRGLLSVVGPSGPDDPAGAAGAAGAGGQGDAAGAGGGGDADGTDQLGRSAAPGGVRGLASVGGPADAAGIRGLASVDGPADAAGIRGLASVGRPADAAGVSGLAGGAGGADPVGPSGGTGHGGPSEALDASDRSGHDSGAATADAPVAGAGARAQERWGASAPEVGSVEAGGHVAEVLPIGPGRAGGVPPAERDPGSVTLGHAVQDGRAVPVGLAALRRHAAIFAGSGSGKTVLIRRLVEECALRGVSSIVLDPNNDLARLGDPWPEPPAHWDAAETARAAAYHRYTDVVVWTPRRAAGRPLSFRPLPDFSAIADDPDAFAAGIDAAVASLAPRANVDGSTTKARIGHAVLREALTAYARGGGTDLRGFVLFLTQFPEHASQLDNAPRIANEIGQLLRANMVTDPLFGGDGAPLDPGELLRPAHGYRARISVISFVGLPDDSQRQSFVNQLQLALFAWIKSNPAGDRPLGGLFVMDEAQTLAPSGAMTACTQSTLALASQARKYGLGLVFATQAPKGLHNRIPGNAATQLFGLLNSPTQIDAAKEMARAKGSDISDVARLRPGHFYAAADGAGFVKLRAPLCLSYHPASPLTAEEVIERARAGVDADDDE
ncbi:DUF87 domain-containing protein [Asanoa sp. WMMD1127]|uniref:ATP-binding protein n=1 Tax=Asanoa sp. WMMD1127 TaxID=3016107 RepID=UPI00241645D1|nr:DUF87 domain-containing protein [Asanoa sp. WMMD1127]MDG4827469.1 DUF87 domain-containing protein [Asanoa sp. WMMD1127]